MTDHSEARKAFEEQQKKLKAPDRRDDSSMDLARKRLYIKDLKFRK